MVGVRLLRMACTIAHPAALGTKKHALLYATVGRRTNLLAGKGLYTDGTKNLGSKGDAMEFSQVLRRCMDEAGCTGKELAQACGSSVSSVMRLCKALKLSGYKELMKSLCGELSVLEENREFEDIHPGDDPEAVMSHLLTSDFGALRTTMEMNDAAELERAVSLLCRARRTDFYGVGSSGLVALDASNKFGRIGKVAVANTDPHNQYITSLSLCKGDAAVVISYSGETTDTVNVAREIAAAGVEIISLTKFGSSTISDLASIRLFTGSTETFMRSGAMSSRICQMFMIDVLYTSVCSRTYKEIRPHLEKTREAALRMHTARGETNKD